MARQFNSSDSSVWNEGFGKGASGTSYAVPANIACSATISTTTVTLVSASTFANAMLVLIHQTKGTGAGAWELNKIISGGGTTTLTMEYPTQNTYTNSGVTSNAQIIELKQYNSLTSGSITCPAWDGAQGGIIAWMDKGTSTINGTLTTVGKGFRASTEYKNQDGPAETDKGEGSGTDTFGTTEGRTANGNGGGGGGSAGSDGGSNGSGGASGGSKTAGSDGYNTGYSTATGGEVVWGSYGSTVTLGGGAGSRVSANAGDAGAAGTNGSGLLFVFAKNIIVTGSITLNSTAGDLTGDSSTYSAGAGGAGSAMFWGETIALGSSLITANGGQAKGTSKFGGNGGIVARYSHSFTGTTSPTTDSIQDLSLRKLRGGASALVGFLAT